MGGVFLIQLMFKKKLIKVEYYPEIWKHIRLWRKWGYKGQIIITNDKTKRLPK